MCVRLLNHLGCSMADHGLRGTARFSTGSSILREQMSTRAALVVAGEELPLVSQLFVLELLEFFCGLRVNLLKVQETVSPFIETTVYRRKFN